MIQVRAIPRDVLDTLISDGEKRFTAALTRSFRGIAHTLDTRVLRVAAPHVVTADAQPGEPFISLDDAQTITTAWATEIGPLIDWLREVFLAGSYGMAAAVSDAALPEAARVNLIAADLVDQHALEHLAQAANRVRRLGDLAWQHARDELVSGFNAGESITELAARVREAADLAEARAITVARTETIMAANGGAHAAASALPEIIRPTVKEWLATDDLRTRETHAAADHQRVGIDERFVVGGSMLRYPGDPLGSPAETINCRCVAIFEIEPPDCDCGTTASLLPGETRFGDCTCR